LFEVLVYWLVFCFWLCFNSSFVLCFLGAWVGASGRGFGHGDAAILIKGSAIKAEYYWWKREVKTYQAIRDWLSNRGFNTWRRYHAYYLHAIYKRRERLRHYYRTAIRFLARTMHGMGVNEVFIGYPYMLSQNNGNEYNANIWWFSKDH